MSQEYAMVLYVDPDKNFSQGMPIGTNRSRGLDPMYAVNV